MSDEIIVNSSSLIEQTVGEKLSVMAKNIDEFKEFIKGQLIDGVDFGLLPSVDKPCLLKSGGEKIQLFMGLTPQYKLLNRTFIPNQQKIDKVYNEETRKYDLVEVVRNYYAWEFSCELYHGEIKVAEGVGMANTEEDKYVKQYKSKTPDGMANTVMKIAKKRAFMDAILGASGLSDLYTQDMDEDYGGNNKRTTDLRVDKKATEKSLSKDQRKTIYANMGALGLVKSDLDRILNEMGATSLNDLKGTQFADICTRIKNLANERKGK